MVLHKNYSCEQINNYKILCVTCKLINRKSEKQSFLKTVIYKQVLHM